MPELVGIITTIKKFMSNSDEDIFFSFEGKKRLYYHYQKKEYIRFQIFKEKLDGHVII